MAVGNTPYDSQNWSGVGVTASPGYFMANGSYVVGVFHVPSIGAENCTYGPYSAAMWVGMDGYASPGANDVLQAGVRADACSSSVEVWFEWFTDGCASWQYACTETDVNLPASAGDAFSISVTYHTTSPHGSAFIVNNTTGQYVPVGFDQPVGSPGSTYAGTSAEWVLERPGYIGISDLENLANYASNTYMEGTYNGWLPGSGPANAPDYFSMYCKFQSWNPGSACPVNTYISLPTYYPGSGEVLFTVLPPAKQ